MRPEERNISSVADMLRFAEESVRIAARYTYESWIVNDEAIYAIEHLVQQIGEAANRTTNEFRADHPEIPWSDIIGMRHIIVHHYEGLDLDKVWKAATDHSTALIAVVRDLLPPLEPETPDDLTPP